MLGEVKLIALLTYVSNKRQFFITGDRCLLPAYPRNLPSSMIPYGQTGVVHQLPLDQRIKKMEFDVGYRGHPGLVALFSEAAYNEQIRLGRPTLDFKQWEYFNLPEKYCRNLILFVHVAGKEMWSDDRRRGDVELR